MTREEEGAVTTTDLEAVHPSRRKDFLRDGAINACWRAHTAHLAVAALEEAIADDPGLAPEKLTTRRNFLHLSKSLMEAERTKQLRRAHDELHIYLAFLDAASTAE